MKTLRVWILVLLAALLPLRGLAASATPAADGAMPCVTTLAGPAVAAVPTSHAGHAMRESGAAPAAVAAATAPCHAGAGLALADADHACSGCGHCAGPGSHALPLTAAALVPEADAAPALFAPPRMPKISVDDARLERPPRTA